MALNGKDVSEDGVFELLTTLCSNVASKYCYQNRVSQKRLANKMRTYSYEIILKKTSHEATCSDWDPIVDLLSYYLFLKQNVKNVADYKRCIELKKIISTIRVKDFGTNKDTVTNVFKFLVEMGNAVKQDLSAEIYKNPFTFGLLDEMLPKLPREPFGSPQPYSYFPSHVFELPISLKRQGGFLDEHLSQTYTEYTLESFDSKSIIPNSSNQKCGSDVKVFLSPMSLVSMDSTQHSPYSENLMFNYPRLTAPRDLHIPSRSCRSYGKVSFPISITNSDIKEVYRGNDDVESMTNIWELATQVDKGVPDDIWDVVSKLPPIKERQLIASSAREMSLWRQVYGGQLSDLAVISERQFIRHLMYLIIGIETTSFPFHPETNSFHMKHNLIIEGVSREPLKDYLSDLLLVGTYYKRLYCFAFNQTLDDHFHSHGLLYEAIREVIRQYLLEFRLLATEIYEECTKNRMEDVNCMPTLLQIRYHMEPLKYEIETVASMYRMIDPEPRSIPHGAELMSYLFNEISLVTHRKTAYTMFTSLFSICKVYFKFIERFIFEGESDDKFNEFFIRKDSQFINCRSKRYWDKGFHITQSVAVPDFLRPIAKFILLCGKSLRLLKMCNPSDPLVLLISSDHPSIKCCASFEELERQQQVLDVYRTRCLFVSGEPVTFDQILLKREAEKKAFTEMASLKQAETLEKIVSERKRLAQLIIAEKQHSLRVLEAAMAEAEAARRRSRLRERRRYQLRLEAEQAAEQVDSVLRDDERNKIMEYYSKLNMEVEKSKIHTEWKIKRLQLDQSRMQLLSTEERNLKREKLELEHQRNEEMAMSIQSMDSNTESDTNYISDKVGIEVDRMTESSSSVVGDLGERSQESPEEAKSQTSDEFSVICNAAKNIVGVSKTADDKYCDNKKKLDAQGNIVTTEAEINFNELETVKSSEVIGNKLDEAYDNIQFLKMRQEALSNKQKVMSHEFGQVDKENNTMKYLPVIKIAGIDQENNMDGDWSTFAEARRNKLKVLGDDFGMKPEARQVVEPKTDAQKEALINKQKVLGVEYNNPLECVKREPLNEAQEQAVKNRKKILGSEYDNAIEATPKREINKRSGLTLNLKPYGEVTTSENLAPTPNPGALTPGDFFPCLDLETPTTADMPLEGAITSDVFTPRSEYVKDLESAHKSNKDFISADGFNFPVIVDDDTVESVVISEVNTEDSPDNSPSKALDVKGKCYRRQYSFFSLLDGSYNLDDFDPYGVRDLKKYSKDHFSSRMDLEMGPSCYTHPAVIMEEVRKPPYTNIFATHYDSEQEKDEKIKNDNIATLTACLQRSVMLPLTYQLEVVNNSILTYFLVNLDMYEHLRSLKDYFFLMDGEFSRSICHNLFMKLSKTINPQELLNFATLHNILDKALGSSISHVHKFSENLSFTITESPLSFHHSSPDALRCVSLTYAVRWPLNIILSQEALLRYAKVFQFLLKMRRVFWVLAEDFEALKLSVKLSRQHSRKLLKSPQYTSIQIYRHIMASMIRALDNYIVTTCILTSWTEFENDLKKARTLDDLYECHVVYIKKVLFRCLLNNRSTPVMKLLNDIFTVILKFSRVLKAGEWQQYESNGHYYHTSYAQLEELFHLFEKLAKYLHKVVTKLMECGYQRHLVELLAMVNLNGYYDPETTKDDTNTSLLSTNGT